MDNQIYEKAIEYMKTTYVSNIQCNHCGSILPPHTMKNHLSKKFMEKFHKCSFKNFKKNIN